MIGNPHSADDETSVFMKNGIEFADRIPVFYNNADDGNPRFHWNAPFQ